MFLPFGFVIGIIIRIDSQGAVLFRQKRVGQHGKLFYLIKFRTMKHDARGLSITSENDIRITNVGKFLRKWKLDELPQLINVIKGEMSFVGPRPEVPEYVQYYNQEQLKVLSVKSGITDIASINFRNESQLLVNSSNVQEHYINDILPIKLKLSLDYINHKSLLYDTVLIIRTLKVVIFN